MKKTIVTDTKILSQVCSEVPDNKRVYDDLFKNLIDTAMAAKNPGAAGLSANQIGELYTAFVMLYNGHYICVMNPKILTVSKKKKLDYEGCLSRPNSGPVEVLRHREIKIRYFDPISEEHITRTFKGFDARIVQHEIDHSKGVLI